MLKRSKDTDGKIIGSWSKNCMLNLLVYDVEFPNGTLKQYESGIAENLYSQVDSDERQYILLDSIIEFGTSIHTSTKDNIYITTKLGSW